MKTLIILTSLLLSNSALARQYIQCGIIGDTTDVAVVNLTTEQGGTLFLSSGMQNDESERVLVKIKLDRKEKGLHYYKVINENGTGFAILPSNVIGKASRYFEVELAFANTSFKYGCFSAIYPDDLK